MVTIDAHHHFWDTARQDRDYVWMTEDLAAIRGCYGPEDLRPLLASRGIEKSLLIQTISSVPETEEFLSIAAATDFVAGVVGWVDLTAPDVADTLARLKSRPDGGGLVGIRHQVHDEADADWLRRPNVVHGIEAVTSADLTYDLLVRSRELPAALDIVQRFPGARFVVDHIAKPPIRSHEMEPWASLMTRLAAYSNVWVKVSGMIEEADWQRWTDRDLEPYVQRLLEWFGPRRLIFGSNWPVCLLAGTYAQVYDALVAALGAIGEPELGWILGENALQAYCLTPE